jgi:hypothetical protein
MAAIWIFLTTTWTAPNFEHTDLDFPSIKNKRSIIIHNHSRALARRWSLKVQDYVHAGTNHDKFLHIGALHWKLEKTKTKKMLGNDFAAAGPFDLKLGKPRSVWSKLAAVHVMVVRYIPNGHHFPLISLWGDGDSILELNFNFFIRIT